MAVVLFLVLLVSSMTLAKAQTFDGAKFEEGLNEFVQDQVKSEASKRELLSWQSIGPNVSVTVPDFGIAAVSSDGTVKDVFGPSTPISRDEDGNIVGILGYASATDIKFEMIGGDRYADYVTKAGLGAQVDAGVVRAVDVMRVATGYIASELCSSPGRPSEITLHLTADFKLVFGASTGTSAKWVLSDTCAQYVEVK